MEILETILSLIFFTAYLFVIYFIAKVIGRLAKIFLDWLQVDRILEVKGLNNALYGLSLSEYLMFLIKLTAFITLLQLISFIQIKEIQMILAITWAYGSLLILVLSALVVGLIFGEILKNVITKTNIKIKEELGESVKLATASLFLLSSFLFSPISSLLNITYSALLLIYSIILTFLFGPLLVAYSVCTFRRVSLKCGRGDSNPGRD